MKISVTTAILAAMATQAFAGSYETRCEVTSVPYQETIKGASPENILGGAIIGGLLGKAATDDNGAAAIGAIIGGAVANENSTTVVTRYKDVETCTNVYIPEHIADQASLERSILQLNDGLVVAKERIMDVQYTIGVAYDGKWGPMSKRVASEYLASLEPEAMESETMYSLVVNDVVIVSSLDVQAIDKIQESLAQAGVKSKIFVDLK